MLKTIKSITVDQIDWDFISLTQSERVYNNSFHILGDLSVNFDSKTGGKVALFAVNPKISAPHFSIKPISMGAAQWYSIECQISKDDLDGVGQLIPCLDASSPQSASLFALVRIFYENGHSEDISSLQVELRRSRTLQTFPISLEDLPSQSRSKVSSARLIFFIEARDVAIDLYGFYLTSVPISNTSYDTDSITRLRAAHETGAPSLKMATVGVGDKCNWTGDTLEHRSISHNVFLDFEQGAGRKVSILQKIGALELDFSMASSCGWRSLEFRFEGVENSGSVLGLIQSKVSAVPQRSLEATIILRQYDESFRWEDTVIPSTLPLTSDEESEARLIDLSPLLSDKRNTHTFGIMLFFPADYQSLTIKELTAFVFDKEIV